MSTDGNGTTAIATTQPRPSPISAGPRGVQLNSLEDMYRFAKYASQSGLAPKGIETPEAIFIALQMGAEVGLTPMASLQNIAVVNGRPSIWGDAMLAVCRGSGVFDESVFEETWAGDGDNYGATCTVRRLPHGKPIVREFSVAKAKKAGLWGKGGPWSQYPDRMLQMRARAMALRDGFSDVLRGFKAAEEMFDVIDVEHGPASPAAPPKSLEDLAARIETPAAVVVSEPAAVETPKAVKEKPAAKKGSAADYKACIDMLSSGDPAKFDEGCHWVDTGDWSDEQRKTLRAFVQDAAKAMQ